MCNHNTFAALDGCRAGQRRDARLANALRICNISNEGLTFFAPSLPGRARGLYLGQPLLRMVLASIAGSYMKFI
jgi:hypothetical protein